MHMAASMTHIPPDDYVATGLLSHDRLRQIRKYLRSTHVRRGFSQARVYARGRGYYADLEQRVCLKATFRSHEVERLVATCLPPCVSIRPDHHIDLLKYTRGGYFRKHTDHVAAQPHGAVQVTILVGLRTLAERAGGRTLIWRRTRAASEAQPVGFQEPVIAGGVLVFNSQLAHEGEVLRYGEKEVLVLTGFVFAHPTDDMSGAHLLRPLSMRRGEHGDNSTLVFDDVRCIVVYTIYDDEAAFFYADDDVDDEGDFATRAFSVTQCTRTRPSMTVYVNDVPTFLVSSLQENGRFSRCRRAYQYDGGVRVVPSRVVDYKCEHARLVDPIVHYVSDYGDAESSEACASMLSTLNAPGVLEQLDEANVIDDYCKTIYHLSEEMCNGGDETYETEDDYTIYRSTKELRMRFLSVSGYQTCLAHCVGHRLPMTAITLVADFACYTWSLKQE